MLYIVCYDIADDRRRERVVKALLDYGPRIQESVFAAHLDEALADRMLDRVRKVIDPAMDRVHAVPVCGTCEGKILALGLAEVKRDADFLIV